MLHLWGCYVCIIINADTNDLVPFNINAWMLRDMTNTYMHTCIHTYMYVCMYTYIHILTYVYISPQPMTTDIMLCSLQFSYKWTHYSQQKGKPNHSFIFILLRSHTAFSRCLHPCAILSLVMNEKHTLQWLKIVSAFCFKCWCQAIISMAVQSSSQWNSLDVFPGGCHSCWHSFLCRSPCRHVGSQCSSNDWWFFFLQQIQKIRLMRSNIKYTVLSLLPFQFSTSVRISNFFAL